MICQAVPPTGRLNVFQRVMLQWSALHPYNAVHTYKLSGPLCLDALRQAIRDTFDLNGIGVAEIDPTGAWYGHHSEDALPEITVTCAEGSAEEAVSREITTELNRPFERPVCRPFRFSVVDAGPNFHYVTLVYDHWTSDSIGARLLMRHILGRYLGLDIPENEVPFDLYPGTYREVFPHRLRGAQLAGPLLRSVGGWLNRSAWRVAYASVHQMSVGYNVYGFKDGTVGNLRQFARDHQASVNDVFLAALCRAMAPYLPKRASRGKSRGMSLGTIVDTRADANEDLSNVLGTFLGYYLVRVPGAERTGLGDLSRQIAAMTRVKKERRSYLDSAVNFRVFDAICPRLKPDSRVEFSRRAMPMTAGITNVYLKNTWVDQEGEGRILDYRRAVSNGPTLPLVISPTTLNDQLNIAVSYRVTGFSKTKIDGLMQSFVEQIETAGNPVKARPAAKPHPRPVCIA